MKIFQVTLLLAATTLSSTVMSSMAKAGTTYSHGVLKSHRGEISLFNGPLTHLMSWTFIGVKGSASAEANHGASEVGVARKSSGRKAARVAERKETRPLERSDYHYFRKRHGERSEVGSGKEVASQASWDWRTHADLMSLIRSGDPQAHELAQRILLKTVGSLLGGLRHPTHWKELQGSIENWLRKNSSKSELEIVEAFDTLLAKLRKHVSRAHAVKKKTSHRRADRYDFWTDAAFAPEESEREGACALDAALAMVAEGHGEAFDLEDAATGSSGLAPIRIPGREEEDEDHSSAIGSFFLLNEEDLEGYGSDEDADAEAEGSPYSGDSASGSAEDEGSPAAHGGAGAQDEDEDLEEELEGEEDGSESGYQYLTQKQKRRLGHWKHF